METSSKHHEMDEDLKQLISFMVGSEEYGMEIVRVKEVIRTPAITPLPKAPSFVKGIINLRGDVIPIIDLRDKFGLEATEYTAATRVIVVDVDGKLVGMIVDAASQVIRIPTDQIEPPPPVAGGLPSDLIEGVGKIGDRLIVLLNIDMILSASDRIQLEGIEARESRQDRETVSTA